MDVFGDSSDDEDYLPDIPSPSPSGMEGYSCPSQNESGNLDVDENVVSQPRRHAIPLPAYDQEDEDDDNINASHGNQGQGVNNLDDEGSRQVEEPSDESLPSVGGEDGNEEASLEVSSAPVGGFRVRVGPDGEEQIEFASESDEISEESDSDDDPPWNEMMGVQPAVQFALPINIVASIANRVNTNQRRASLSAISRIGELSGENQTPGSSSTAARTGTARMSTAGRPTVQTVRRQRKQTKSKKRKAKKKKPAKKKKVASKKPPSPPKPLGPLYIEENWNGNEELDYKVYSKLIKKMKMNRVVISFTENEDCELPHEQKQLPEMDTNVEQNNDNNAAPGPSSAISENGDTGNVKISGRRASQTSGKLEGVFAPTGFKIGQVQFDRCGRQRWLWRNKSELLAAYEVIQDIILYVSSQPGESILHMRVKRTLRGEQIQERTGPPPKLSSRDSTRELIYNVTQHYFYHVDPVGVPADLFALKGLGNRKTFLLDFHEFDMQNERFIFDVVLLESAILGDHDVHSIPTGQSNAMQDVFTNFLGVTPPPPPLEEEAHQKEDIEWFYGQIRKYHKQEQLPPSDIPLQPEKLKPLLRNYQRDAVHWMLYREGCLNHCEAHSSPEYQHRVDLIEAFLCKMYVPIKLYRHDPTTTAPVAEAAFYNQFTSYVCWKMPTVPSLPTGGILCDEMGLGKTVETLCLILLNKKPTPEGLQEYFEGEKLNIGENIENVWTSVDTEKQENIGDSCAIKQQLKEEDNSTSSSWEESDLDSEASDASTEMPVDRKRRRGTGRGVKTKKSKKTFSAKAVATRRIFQSRRRATSPCEFSTSIDDSPTHHAETPVDETRSDEKSIVQRRPPRKSAQQARVTTKAALEAIEKSMEGKKKRKVKGSEGEPEPAKKTRAPPGTTYQALKTLYESALEDYRFADAARSQPKFHGKFYETHIEVRECFECVCGYSEDEWKGAPIVKCSICGSSQHMECVGYDEDLHRLFGKLGRNYLCPHCESLEAPFETKSTLIITPQSISHQWIKEIQRHVRESNLSILFYKGVGHHGYLPPGKLGQYDIVITTYSVLSAELDYVDLPHCNSADGRRFRNPKRFLSIPSPLPSVLWWRVCLDEAQMVEGINTKMSIMALRIQAVHRWCVTGTPVNKGLQDLFGLFVFLKAYPISYDIWWNVLVRNAFFRKETDLLYELFGQMIWRNGKQDVLDQLGIPPQTEVIHWLNFSPIEAHFYKQQFEICSNRILEKIIKLQRLSPDVDILNKRISSLDRFTLNSLLAPFLELRQACCHPQIVKGHLISLQKGTLTMEELLDKLVLKAQLQCLDDHRLIVAALNGMAGLLIILNNWIEAAEKYREVLQSAEKHKEHFRTDSLQLLHTMENLAEILDGNHAGIAFTLRDSSLRSEAAELRKKYMKKYADNVRAAVDTVYQHTKAVEEIQDQFTMHQESWWVSTLKSAQKLQKIDGLIQSLKQDLLDVSKKNIKKTNSVANKFNDRWGLEQALVPAILEMDELRTSVLDGLQELQSGDPAIFVESAIRCHLRQKSDTYYNDSTMGESKCKLCTYHDNFLVYESVIFKADMKDKISRTGRNWQQRKLLGDLADDDEITEKTRNELLQQEAEDLKATTEHVQLINEELRRGTWGDSETEVLLKGILRFARINRLSKEISENGGLHIKLLEAVKKEFRYLRILWRQIFDQVSALDELSQATTRLIAVTGNVQNQQERPSTSSKIKQLSSGIVEKTLKIQNIHVIGYHEIEPKMSQMRTDYVTGQESLSLHLGQLLYLKTLKRNGYGKKGTLNTEDCPICSIQLGKEWSVLRCGHSYCSECVKKMCPNTLQSFLCPLCRHSMKFADVSFVDTTENEQEMSPETSAGTSSSEPTRKVREVKGSHSTKVEAIVEKLLQLQDSHPGEKCIIFSMWTEVLEIIANALNQNDIKHCFLNQSGRAFHANLDKFKEREDLQVLLMPLTSGAKGLNIIEATHVALVEPILNLASELQAIGRVHRIGQTKPTFVHRFYVKRTIEEKLYQILKVQDLSSDEEGSLTVKDLQNLLTTAVPK